MKVSKGAVKGNAIVFDEPLGLPDGKRVEVEVRLVDDERQHAQGKSRAEGVLDKEYAVFNDLKERLEAKHHLEWVVIHQDEFVGVFKQFEDAADVAVRRFGRGPYLITQIGAPPTYIRYRPEIYTPLPEGFEIQVKCVVVDADD